jgi:hypothetical protein
MSTASARTNAHEQEVTRGHVRSYPCLKELCTPRFSLTLCLYSFQDLYQNLLLILILKHCTTTTRLFPMGIDLPKHRVSWLLVMCAGQLILGLELELCGHT